MKNLVKVFAFMSVLFVFACTKDNSTTANNVVDAQTFAINELTALTATSLDTAKGPDGHERGQHGCGNKGGFGNMGKGHHEHPEGIKGDSIGFKDLPATAQATLTASGDAAKILRIVRIKEADGTIRFVVRLTDKKHIHFDANGAVITLPSREHAFTAITIDELPAAAKAHVLANTTVDKITHIIKITKQDGSIEYGVRTSDNKDFHYDANGAVIAGPVRKKK
jgi:Putative beta-lactamase-inhibitor-like, PepSY-like